MVKVLPFINRILISLTTALSFVDMSFSGTGKFAKPFVVVEPIRPELRRRFN